MMSRLLEEYEVLGTSLSHLVAGVDVVMGIRNLEYELETMQFTVDSTENRFRADVWFNV